jgi:transcriptional regulator with XRE-family HTH domain
MTAPELKELLDELKAWCAQERGRQAKVAREVGVSRHLVNDWLFERKKPSLEQYFALQAFSKKARRNKPRTRAL